MGFSDTTVSHFMCLKAGLASFYGPSIMAGFAENGSLFPYMVASVARTVFSADPIGEVSPNLSGWTAELLDWGEPAHQDQKRQLNSSDGWRYLQGTGKRRGHLIGGCIEVLDWLRGTVVWPESAIWKDAILFLETSEDGPSPTAVQRILRSFAAAGVFNEINGLLFGRPGGQVPIDRFAEYDRAVITLVSDELGLHDLPVVTGLDFGHTDPMMVVPYGMDCEIDADNQRIAFMENAVAG